MRKRQGPDLGQPILFSGFHGTSRNAAESLRETARSMERRVYAFIVSQQGATCDEIEIALGMKHQTASARIRGLVLKRLIRKTRLRRDTRSGRDAIVWRRVRRTEADSADSTAPDAEV